ncbi:hypothetical protein DMB66_14760 [Actinoplanes sp. ATCC 53533]|uniref:hypothetical protein n=1 Tax=Actinoplanes sp. ATCC 53533 TaxID=1288362 RepID=UPI000F76E30E|nr:hypothetical protein [Actinoplanes sp. ATCC 53533]RSM67839.1 hypothetical protein DMB66_14760 [Actinoplanes sp. ATCC 53533]
MRKITKRSAAIAVAAVVAVGATGAAWAAWSISGSGKASAKAGTVVPLTVTGDPVVDALVPGSKSSVTFKVKNDNKFPVTIQTIKYSDFTSSAPACAKSIEQVEKADLPDGLVVAAETEKTYTYAQSLKLVDDPSNACQGKDFGFTVTVNATS